MKRRSIVHDMDKDGFEQFRDYKTAWAAERFIDARMTTALKSRIEPTRKSVKTRKKYRGRIPPLIETRQTNAKSEGINKIIKLESRRPGIHLNTAAMGRVP